MPLEASRCTSAFCRELIECARMSAYIHLVRLSLLEEIPIGSSVASNIATRVMNLFYSAGLHRNHVLATTNTGKIGRCFGKNAGEWTGRVEISKEEIRGSKRSMYGHILNYSRLYKENV